MADDWEQPAAPDEVSDPERREAGPAPEFDLVRPYVSAMVDPDSVERDAPTVVTGALTSETVMLGQIPAMPVASGASSAASPWRSRTVRLEFGAMATIVVIALISLYSNSFKTVPTADPSSKPAAVPSAVTSPSPSPSAASVTFPTGGPAITTPKPSHSKSASPSPSSSTTAPTAPAPSSTPSTTPPAAPPPPPPPAPLTGTITDFSGMCLDDNGIGNQDGNHIQIYSCNGTQAQTWSWQSDGTVHIVGKCMQVTGTGAGSLVELWDCNGSSTEVWHATGHGSIVNTGSGLCLEDPGYSRNSGTQLDINGCSRQANQWWTLHMS